MAAAVVAALLLATASSLASGEPTELRCPVPLVEIAADGDGSDASPSHSLQLNEMGLSYLASLKAPLFVVPAVGVYRSGKSYMLNRLRGLKAPYDRGFGVGHTRDTFTRGIEICAEEADGVGTIVWMDTEGLFSAEEAEGAYGPKLFSMALLFSSTVLLNSKTVLSGEFFKYFTEQQQVARVLKQGLSEHGLPEDSLLPQNLSLIWVLSQPQEFDGTGTGAQDQLERFLDAQGDETRKRVKRDFQHSLRELPVISHDTRNFRQVESLEESEILPEYLQALAGLRTAVIGELRKARPLHAASVVSQLRMYAELIRTEKFSDKLVLEVFEEAELGTLCAVYSQAIAEGAGPLPVRSLEGFFREPLEDIKSRRALVVEQFHLSEDWERRLERCLRSSEAELRLRNAEHVLAAWKAAAAAKSEEGSCFFLDSLVRLNRNYSATYGSAFDAAVQRQAIEFGSTLQRSRLVECVRLRDLLWPFVPWVVGPLCAVYLRGGFAGLIHMVLHLVGFAGIYALLQTFGQLHPFFDVDYAVLRHHPRLLELLMRAPPLVPWAFAARVFGLVGAARSTWLLLKRLAELGRPAGRGFERGQMQNLELKLNALLARSRAAFKQQLDAAALEAADRLRQGDRLGARQPVLRGLAAAIGVEESDHDLALRLNRDLRTRARELLRGSTGSGGASGARSRGGKPCTTPASLEQAVVGGDWDEVLLALLQLYEELCRERAQQEKDRRRSSGACCASPKRSAAPAPTAASKEQAAGRTSAPEATRPHGGGGGGGARAASAEVSPTKKAPSLAQEQPPASRSRSVGAPPAAAAASGKREVRKAVSGPLVSPACFKSPEPMRRGGLEEARSFTESEPEPACVTPPRRGSPPGSEERPSCVSSASRSSPGAASPTSLRAAAPGSNSSAVGSGLRRRRRSGGGKAGSPLQQTKRPTPVRRSLWGWLRGGREDVEEAIGEELGSELISPDRRSSLASSLGSSHGREEEDLDDVAEDDEECDEDEDDNDDDMSALHDELGVEHEADIGFVGSTAGKAGAIVLGVALSLGVMALGDRSGLLPGPADTMASA